MIFRFHVHRDNKKPERVSGPAFFVGQPQNGTGIRSFGWDPGHVRKGPAIAFPVLIT